MRRQVQAWTVLTVGLTFAHTAFCAEPVPLVAQGCVGCHGLQGTGSGTIPGIAGRPAAEIAATMNAFRANERPGTIMGRIARGYTEAEIATVAAYYSTVR